jgi:hypothetical protein
MLFIVERRRGARPGVLAIVATLVAAAVFAWILLELDARWWVQALLITVLTTPAMAIANAMYRADVLRAQRGRDSHATSLARAVMASERVERFALYLRPFVSTDRLMAESLLSDVAGLEVPVYLDVEALLARAFRTTVPVIALGKSGDTVEGAARVTVGDDVWRETVEALSLQAVFIAMVPFSRPGTMWELEWLKWRSLLDKTLFIMPESPNQPPSGVVVSQEAGDRIFDAGVRQFEAAAHMLDLPKEWSDVERVVSRFGLAFPPRAAVGALFTMNSTNGAVKDIVPLGLSMSQRRIRHLRASVERLGLLPALKAQPDFIEGFSKVVFWGGRTLECARTRRRRLRRVGRRHQSSPIDSARCRSRTTAPGNRHGVHQRTAKSDRATHAGGRCPRSRALREFRAPGAGRLAAVVSGHARHASHD